MADADGSYDFGHAPRIVAKLQDGYDLVMGNRFLGGIEPGAMPWHHKYIGNPIFPAWGACSLNVTGAVDRHTVARAAGSLPWPWGGIAGVGKSRGAL